MSQSSRRAAAGQAGGPDQSAPINGKATIGYPGPRPVFTYKAGWEDRVPTALIDRDQWIVWRYELNPDRTGWTKVPYRPHAPRRRAATDDPQTWDPFARATQTYHRSQESTWKLDGVAYVFSADDPFVGSDVDHGIGPDGEVLDWAKPYISRLAGTYLEFSPSGLGLKGFAIGELPGRGVRKGGFGPDGTGAIELYDRTRFFTITGDPFDSNLTRIEDRSEALTLLYRELRPKASVGANGANGKPLADDDRLIDLARNAKNGEKFRALFDRGEDSTAPSDSERDFRLCCRLAFWFNRNAEAIDRVFRRSALMRDKWDSPRSDTTYGAYTIDNAIAITPPDEVYTPKGANLPEILVTTEEHEVIDAAVVALAKEPTVYQRGNALVTIFRDSAPAKGLLRPAGSPRLAPIPAPRVRKLLTLNAAWKRQHKTRNGDAEVIPTHPPDWAVSGVVHQGEWPGIRHAEAVIETPVLRPDGSIIDVPGWDPATGLIYEPNTTFPAIAARPKKDDVDGAAQALLDLVVDFPFLKEVHRAAWLAALLTPFARFAIAGPCPLFLFDANTSGSGKTKLCDLIAIVNTGRPMARTTYPETDDEMRKRISSIALAGDRLMLLDNIATTFGGASLDAALTSLVWKDRILGRTEMTAEMPLFTVWYATGNNVVLRGDIVRRIVHSRIETKDERPEERDDFTIKGDLLAHTQSRRPALVTAALTILRGYISAGRPDRKLPRMDFVGWSDLVRSAVHWAVGEDPAGDRKSLRDSDPETQLRAAFIEGWSALPGAAKGVTVAEALRLLKADPDGRLEGLHDALMEWSRNDQLPSARSIGMRLNAIKGRVAGGRAIYPVPAERGVNAWRVGNVT